MFCQVLCIWQGSPRAGNDPYRIGVFGFGVKPLNWWIYFQTFSNLLCVSVNTTVPFLIVLVNQFHLFNLAKQPLNLASKYFFEIWCGLGAISTQLEI